MSSKPNNLHIPRSELCLSYVHACCLLARWLACWVTADSHDALLNIHPGHDCPMFVCILRCPEGRFVYRTMDGGDVSGMATAQTPDMELGHIL